MIKNVALIMDGNGRWAKGRSRPRFWGHIRGSKVVSEIVEAADDLGLESLTLYAFSTENWSRPQKEILLLFKLLKKYVLKEWDRVLKNDICFKVIGELSGLPKETYDLVKKLEEKSKNAKGLKLNFAFGYGGRTEICRAVNQFIKENPGKEIDSESLANSLYNPAVPEIDLLIRTGGDQRISNFLLWQMAYAELYFLDTQWPDFSREIFESILSKVSNRERRFGAIDSQTSLTDTCEKAKAQKDEILKATGPSVS
ncbi:MAG: polyprenyl diphosphate synthase [Bacteriovoracaceae bacterium]